MSNHTSESINVVNIKPSRRPAVKTPGTGAIGTMAFGLFELRPYGPSGVKHRLRRGPVTLTKILLNAIVGASILFVADQALAAPGQVNITAIIKEQNPNFASNTNSTSGVNSTSGDFVTTGTPSTTSANSTTGANSTTRTASTSTTPTTSTTGTTTTTGTTSTTGANSTTSTTTTGATTTVGTTPTTVTTPSTGLNPVLSNSQPVTNSTTAINPALSNNSRSGNNSTTGVNPALSINPSQNTNSVSGTNPAFSNNPQSGTNTASRVNPALSINPSSGTNSTAGINPVFSNNTRIGTNSSSASNPAVSVNSTSRTKSVSDTNSVSGTSTVNGNTTSGNNNSGSNASSNSTNEVITSSFKDPQLYAMITSALANAGTNGTGMVSTNLPSDGYIAFDPNGSDGTVTGTFYVTNRAGFYFPLSGRDANDNYFSFIELDTANAGSTNSESTVGTVDFGFPGNFNGIEEDKFNNSNGNGAGNGTENITSTALFYAHDNPYSFDGATNADEYYSNDNAIVIHGIAQMKLTFKKGEVSRWSVSLQGTGNAIINGSPDNVITSARVTVSH